MRSTERALAVLWQRADALPDGLVAEDGRRFRVVYPGRRSSRAGPDFRDAVMVTDAGERITGDVELHLNAPDWHGHRHDADPAYNGVVLHVVLHPKGRMASAQQSKTATPVASLAPVADLLARVQTVPEAIPADLEAPDASNLFEDSREALDGKLDRAGDARFLAKSRGFSLEMLDADPEQVLHRAVMEALGYASNTKPFRELAERVPMSLLAMLRREPAATRLLAIRAMLVETAGLTTDLESPEESRLLKRLRRQMPGAGPMSAGQWRLFRIRPANHPLKRIAGAAHLVDRYIEAGLVRGLEESVSSMNAKRLVEALAVPPLIGKGRAGDIAVNVVLPFFYAFAGARRSPHLRALCLELYHAFPTLEENEITREMRRLLIPDALGVTIATARRQQGLMHLYRGVSGVGCQGKSFFPDP